MNFTVYQENIDKPEIATTFDHGLSFFSMCEMHAIESSVRVLDGYRVYI